jgi:hypothetical protein
VTRRAARCPGSPSFGASATRPRGLTRSSVGATSRSQLGAAGLDAHLGAAVVQHRHGPPPIGQALGHERLQPIGEDVRRDPEIGLEVVEQRDLG